MLHIFGFQWKNEATSHDRERARTDILGFQGLIPGLLETYVGPNVSTNEHRYTFVGFMRFKDISSFRTYNQHPTHQALLTWLVPLIDAVELDFDL